MHVHRDAQHGREADEVRPDMAVADGAVVGRPIGHDRVDVAERADAGGPRHEPVRGPGGVRPLVEDVVDLLGQVNGPALGDLENRAGP